MLGNRSVIVPLVTTADKTKANRQVQDASTWPHDRGELIDDLWALSLEHLPSMTAYDRQAASKASLAGRNLEPWRDILAVALWLEDQGVKGIWEEMSKLSLAYQGERGDLQVGTLNVVVVKALRVFLFRAIDKDDLYDPYDLYDPSCEAYQNLSRNTFSFKTKDFTKIVKEVAQKEEANVDYQKLNPSHIGRLLGKMRLPRERESYAKGWAISYELLQRLYTSYGMTFTLPKPATSEKSSGNDFRDPSKQGSQGSQGSQNDQSPSPNGKVKAATPEHHTNGEAPEPPEVTEEMWDVMMAEGPPEDDDFDIDAFGPGQPFPSNEEPAHWEVDEDGNRHLVGKAGT